MKIIKAYPTCLVILLLGAAGIIYLFFHFGSHDARALSDFSSAYHRFDAAVTEYATAVVSTAGTRDALAQESQAALADLQGKAAVRISSLTRNDAGIMNATAEVARLGNQELAALNALEAEGGGQAANHEAQLQAVSDLTRQRQAAYARFLELAGLKN